MSAREVDDVAEISRMALALGEFGYRDLAADNTRQRLAVSRRLWREGIDERVLRLLFAYAEQCGQQPVRLFAWWLDRPSRAVAKVNEMRERSGWTRRVLEQQQREAAKPAEPAAVHDIGRWRRSAGT